MQTEFKCQLRITRLSEDTCTVGSKNTRLTHAKSTQKYHDGITGVGESHYLLSYKSRHLAKFIGHELFTGEIDGRRGSLVSDIKVRLVTAK